MCKLRQKTYLWHDNKQKETPLPSRLYLLPCHQLQQQYFKYAESILKNLSGKNYLAEKGENQGYVLMHSAGSLPHGSEIDTPLNYADYYYLEALKRYLDMQK